MTRAPQIKDLRHRFDWHSRGKGSSRNVYPWAEMREGDAIILPICTEKGQPKDLFSKRARRTFLTFLKSGRVKAWHKEHPLRLESRRLTKDDGRGEGYMCTMVRGQLPAEDLPTEPWPDIRYYWSQVPVGGALYFETEASAIRAAAELRRMALDPKTDVPPNHAAALPWYDQERKKYVAKRVELPGRYQKAVVRPVLMTGTASTPALSAAIERTDETWERDSKEARRIMKENPGSVLTRDRALNFITVDDEEDGARLYANEGAKAFFEEQKARLIND